MISYLCCQTLALRLMQRCRAGAACPRVFFYVLVSLDYINIVLCLVLIGRQAFRLTQCLPSKSMATALPSLLQVGQHSFPFVCKALGPPVLKWDLSVSL